MPSSALFLDLLALSAFPTRRSSDLIARSGPVHRGAALRPGPVPDKTNKAHLSMRLFLETIPVMQRPCPGQGQHRTPASVDSVLQRLDRKSTRLNSSHVATSYAVFCFIPRPPRSLRFPYTTLFRSNCPQRPCSSRCGLAPRARARQNKKGTPLDAPFPGDHPCDATPLPRARAASNTGFS